MNGLNQFALPHETAEQNTKHTKENNMPSKGSKEEHQHQQSRINKLMTGHDFGWKTPSTHATRKNEK